MSCRFCSPSSILLHTLDLYSKTMQYVKPPILHFVRNLLFYIFCCTYINCIASHHLFCLYSLLLYDFDIFLVAVTYITVTDNRSRGQPACLEEWKMCKRRNINDNCSMMYISVCYVSYIVVMIFTLVD
jgi:hypothetical protein